MWPVAKASRLFSFHGLIPGGGLIRNRTAAELWRWREEGVGAAVAWLSHWALNNGN